MDQFILVTPENLRTIVLESVTLALKYHSPVTTPTGDADELFTPEETAKFLKVSKVTVWDWSKRGILSPRRICNQVRYLRSEVLAAAVQKGKLIGAAHA